MKRLTLCVCVPLALCGAGFAQEGSPRLELSILATASGDARLTVAGTNGGLYGISASTDFKNWTHWPTKPADAGGRVEFTTSLSASRIFYRAFAVAPTSPDADPPEVALGERLFRETRFAQYFAVHSGGNVNVPLQHGDPVMDVTVTLNGEVPGPFSGQSMNCRACHLVDEHQGRALGNRTYADFARRSPVPDRGDRHKTTPRNSPSLVNASIDRPSGLMLHFDAEFVDGKSLVKAGYTGRNFGWLPEERAQAAAHIAKVIRADNGEAFLGPDYGGSYRKVLAGTDPTIPGDFRLPDQYRLDVDSAMEDQILDAVASLVDAYTKSLTFITNAEGEYDATPYDLFLRKNRLPRRPAVNEDDKAYGRRLLALVRQLEKPVFVTPADGSFTTQNQEFRFGARELQGLKLFLSEPSSLPAQGGIGNCIACHAPPHFTDFSFHNTGAAQQEYDSIHGEGAFAQLPIPNLDERSGTPSNYLPATTRHPAALERFRAVPSLERPGFTDVGLWNIFANDDFPSSQPALLELLSARFGTGSTHALLPKTIALFKTPGLRDLGQSAPYLHTGQADSLEDVMHFYTTASSLARSQKLRNSDPEVAGIFLDPSDVNALVAFLNSLTEDYD